MAGIEIVDLLEAFPEFDSASSVDFGGQKAVYRVEQDGLCFALKILLIKSDGDGRGEDPCDEVVAEAIARARREVAILSACTSPYVVKPGPTSLGTRSVAGVDVAFYSEEWVEGDNLKQIIESQGALDIFDVIELGTQMLSALDELWSLRTIHRDIKPANIMRRSNDGSFVLLDLGFALDLDDESLTRVVGGVPGTPAYFSPERLDLNRKRELDFRSDLFSLGILLYEAATGVHPFRSPGQGMDTVVKRIVSEPHIPPSSVCRELPAAFDDVLGIMLEKKPHLRYRKCSRAVDALRDLRGR